MALAKDQGINRALGKTFLNYTALYFQYFCGISFVIITHILHYQEESEAKFFIFLLMD